MSKVIQCAGRQSVGYRLLSAYQRKLFVGSNPTISLRGGVAEWLKASWAQAHYPTSPNLSAHFKKHLWHGLSPQNCDSENPVKQITHQHNSACYDSSENGNQLRFEFIGVSQS